MKIIKGFIIIIVVTLLLAGCNAKSESTRTFILDEGGIKVTMVYTYKGDQVIKQSAENIIQYDLAGISSKEELQGLLDPIVKQYQNVKGLTHTIVYSDTEAIEELEINYETANLKEIIELPGMDFEAEGDFEFISMKKSAEMLISNGFIEVE